MEKHGAFLHLIKNFLSEEIISCNLDNYNRDSFQLFRNSFRHSEVPIT